MVSDTEPQLLVVEERLGELVDDGEPERVYGIVVGTAVRLPLAHDEGEPEREGDCESDGLCVVHADTEGERVTLAIAELAAGVRVVELQPVTVGETLGERDIDGEPVPVMYCVVATGVALTLEHCEEERDCVGERVTDAQPLNESDIVLQALAVEERQGEPDGDGETESV